MGVVGSNPTASTMDIVDLRKNLKVSDFYKNLGYKRIYIYQAKDGRRSVTLYKNKGECLSMSYAKYLYTSHYKEFVDAKYYQIDHIDGNKLNDDIKNLQRISREYNARKDKKIKEYVELECPICHTKFLFEKGNLSSHPNPCCSRSCGGKKSRLKKI